MQNIFKKYLLGLVFALLGTFSYAQGLENIIVEKYYVSDAVDAAGSSGALPVGSVTYRVYADLAPNYVFQAIYGNLSPSHELKVSSSTTFFNNEDFGGKTPPTTSLTNIRKNSVMLDSWFSVGGATSAKVAILKNDDTDGAVVNNTVPLMLQNADPSAGVAISVKDGMIAGTPEAVTFVGFTTELDVFDGTSQVGGSFSTFNGSVASLNGSTGPTADNRVLLGQFTTDGVFGFELNVQIKNTITNVVERYVARNPQGTEQTIPSLILEPNVPPTISSFTATPNGSVIVGTNIALNAVATDVAPGTVSSVKFYHNGTLISIDNSSPYDATFSAIAGANSFIARAFDNLGDSTTSSTITVTGGANQAPTISVVAAPSPAIVGDNVTITATAADADGTVSQVEFFVDNVSIGTDNSSPFTFNWVAVLGSHNIKGVATDNLNATTTSSIISINVVANTPPTAAITSPVTGASFTAPAVVTINATATDADGTVTQVEFFVNNISVGVDATSPYSFNWTSVIGAASLTVKSTDNKGAITTSAAVLLTIADPLALPYRVNTLVQTCLPTTFNIPVSAVDAVDNVIGYDIVMFYDKTRVSPTGTITVRNVLVDSLIVDASNSIDENVGRINISLFFNGTAPSNAEFNGVGKIVDVEFSKTSGFANVDTAVFTVSSLQESYITGVATKPVESGKYITYRDSLFTSSLKFWADNSPIKYNAALPNDYLVTNIFGNNGACTNKSLTSVQPDLTGNFTYNILNGLDVMIERDILSGTSVQPIVNGFDALQVRKLLINDPSFIPTIFQMIAMDVNADGVISSGDLSQINQRAVLILPEYRQAWNYTNGGVSNGQPSKDWLFIDAATLANDNHYKISPTFPLDNGVGFSKYRVPVVPFCLPVTVQNAASCPLISSETYKGIALGDVNGNYQNILNNGTLRSKEKIVFDLAHAVTTDNMIEIPVSFVSANSVYALDFSMKFNERKLAFNSIVSHSSSIQALDYFNTEDQTLRFTSNSLLQYNVDKPIVSVRFNLNKVEVTTKDLYSLVGYLNGDVVDVEVLDVSTGTNNDTKVINTEVYPNPTSGMLNIFVTEDANIQILDVNGKQIYMQGNVLANKVFETNVSNLPNGVYIIKFFNNNFVSTKKVVISK
ncbi:MAG: T9SS type A sorting domain-containing protein [Saprospiraceae bacterium]|nr:T9SS type A sorting domain-containing protein [Candidatus Defluviibacterium haderslevense]